MMSSTSDEDADAELGLGWKNEFQRQFAAEIVSSMALLLFSSLNFTGCNLASPYAFQSMQFREFRIFYDSGVPCVLSSLVVTMVVLKSRRKSELSVLE